MVRLGAGVPAGCRIAAIGQTDGRGEEMKRRRSEEESSAQRRAMR